MLFTIDTYIEIPCVTSQLSPKKTATEGHPAQSTCKTKLLFVLTGDYICSLHLFARVFVLHTTNISTRNPSSLSFITVVLSKV